LTTGAFTVVCTGRGAHKRYTFNEVTVTADGLRCNAARKAAAPDLKGKVVDDLELPGYVIMRAYDPRRGVASWGWECPQCPADSRFAGDDELRAWLATITGRVADISRRT
jgi:hypothetical protein